MIESRHSEKGQTLADALSATDVHAGRIVLPPPPDERATLVYHYRDGVTECWPDMDLFDPTTMPSSDRAILRALCSVVIEKIDKVTSQ
jgi:hypothetical protein